MNEKETKSEKNKKVADPGVVEDIPRLKYETDDDLKDVGIPKTNNVFSDGATGVKPKEESK